MRATRGLAGVCLALALAAPVMLWRSPARADFVYDTPEYFDPCSGPGASCWTFYDPCAADRAACGSLTPFTPQAGMTVPEPSTWVMLLAGFTGLAYVGLRKARTKAAAEATAGH
jgi:hypothetical protein